MFAFLRMKYGFYKKFVAHKLGVYQEQFYLRSTRKKLNNKNFTIISNNCWGGSVYEDLGLSYTTPTVGLFFFAPCYLKFISDLETNLKSQLHFVHKSKYEKGNYLQTLNSYPIGILNGDIEIHFLHYTSERDAFEKWNRRAVRVNFDNLFFSFTDDEECTMKEIIAFDQLPFKKVFFSAKQIEGVHSLVFLKCYRNQKVIGNLYDNRWNYRNYFNVVQWLNSKLQ